MRVRLYEAEGAPTVSLKDSIGFELKAEDAPVGRACNFFIDERSWTFGYADVPVGGSGERVLIAVSDLVLSGKDRLLTSSSSRFEPAAMATKDLVTRAEDVWAAENGETPPRAHGVQPHSSWRSFNALLVSNIAASGGGNGLLDDLLVEPQQWSVQYFVGRSYSWKKKPSVDVSVSREALEREPRHKPASHSQAQ